MHHTSFSPLGRKHHRGARLDCDSGSRADRSKMNERWHDDLLSLPTEEVPHCLLCKTMAGVEDARWRSLLALPNPYSVLHCPRCGLRWLSPRPDMQGYRLLYSREHYFGGGGAAPENYEAVVAGRLDYFSKRIRRAAVALQRRAPLSMLDYGAATGEFVAVARSEGHLCEGIELSDDARNTAEERLGIVLLSAQQADQLEPSQFDVVHMNHVLEHMPDPLAHLRWSLRLLKADGLLVVEVPQQFDNDLDRVRRFLRMGGRQRRFDAYSLHHTYFFTPATMTRMLRVAGFEPQTINTFNADKTPLWPPSARNWILRAWLGLSDRVHDGGNIVEVFARPRDKAIAVGEA